jgi:hypothetical protein
MAGTPKPKHERGDPSKPIESVLPCKDPCGALYEAYRKHSASLASIEDRENKFLLLILTVFGAGATAVSKINLKGHCPTTWYLTTLVVIIVCVGFSVIHETHDLRVAVRDLLVQCELAMQFYTPGVFLKDLPLYQDAERQYAVKGKSQEYASWFFITIAGLGLIGLIWHDYCYGLSGG